MAAFATGNSCRDLLNDKTERANYTLDDRLKDLGTHQFLILTSKKGDGKLSIPSLMTHFPNLFTTSPKILGILWRLWSLNISFILPNAPQSVGHKYQKP